MNRNLDDNPAVVGKLDGVTHQIHQNLSKSEVIAHDPVRHFGREIADQFQFFRDGLWSQTLQDSSNVLSQVKRARIESESADLHLGEVQNLVNDYQQGFG